MWLGRLSSVCNSRVSDAGATLCLAMGSRVLLLDDEPAITTSFARALRSHNIHIDGCTEVDDFMRTSERPDFDAFLIDWHLPMCEGTEVCVRLRARGDRRPIGIMSAKLDVAHGRRAAEFAGADGYIAKPSDTRTLADEISALVRQSEAHLRVAQSPDVSMRGPGRSGHYEGRPASGRGHPDESRGSSPA